MHALLISHLRSQIPMVGKDRKKAELIKHLDEVRIDNIANGTTDPWVDSWHHNWREWMMWRKLIPGLPQASGRAQYSSSRLPWRRCHAWKAKKVQMCFLSTLEVFFLWILARFDFSKFASYNKALIAKVEQMISEVSKSFGQISEIECLQFIQQACSRTFLGLWAWFLLRT